MMSEKKCGSCAMMIPKEARVCPYCRKKQGVTLAVKVVVGGFLLAGIISAIGGQPITPSSPTKTPAQKEADLKDYAIRSAAIEILKRQLKAPSTADLPTPYDLDVAPHKTEKKTWLVSGTVDAQNSYGAKLRNHFQFTIKEDGALAKSKFW